MCKGETVKFVKLMSEIQDCASSFRYLNMSLTPQH